MSAADDHTVGLVMLGGGAVAAGALAWRAYRSRQGDSTPTTSQWVHPVPSLGDRSAVISNPFRANASSDGKRDQHLGADLMYRRRDARDLIAAFPIGTEGGTPLFFMPENVPALAASTGVVMFASWTPVGNTVIVRHPNGWATYYTHLASLAVSKGASVAAGQPIGTIGGSPEDGPHLRHLHFELWQGATRTGATDPAPFLAAWSRATVEWSAASSISERRNAALSSYRPVGDRGEPYPIWVRDLRDTSGVYVIREIGGPIVYVGSSVRRLYETLTRHFQTVLAPIQRLLAWPVRRRRRPWTHLRAKRCRSRDQDDNTRRCARGGAANDSPPPTSRQPARSARARRRAVLNASLISNGAAMQEPIFDITSFDPKTKKLRARLHPSARPIDEPWRWPLPRLAGRDPIVLAKVDAHRHSVDLGYAAAPYDSELFIPVFAAKAGEVSYATETEDGFALSLVHGDWTTHYAHLSQMFVTRCLPRARRRQFIPAGTVIGYAAKSPLHLRFELWQWTDESGFVAVDPAPHLSNWQIASAGNDRRALAPTDPAHEAA